MPKPTPVPTTQDEQSLDGPQSLHDLLGPDSSSTPLLSEQTIQRAALKQDDMRLDGLDFLQDLPDDTLLNYAYELSTITDREKSQAHTAAYDSLEQEKDWAPSSRKSKKQAEKRIQESIDPEDEEPSSTRQAKSRRKRSDDPSYAETRRQKNRDSARGSRARKLQYVESLENTIKKHELDYAALQERVHQLEGENNALRYQLATMTQFETQKIRPS